MSKKRRKIKCSTNKKDGSPCGKWAVKGFDVCGKHGAGTKKNPGGRPIKTGLHSKVLKRELKEKVQAYLEDPQLLDMRVNIALKRALLDKLVANQTEQKGKLNVATINNAVTILDAISRDIERYEKIEHGEKHTISISLLQQSVHLIVAIIDKHVTSEKIKERIFSELGRSGLVGDNRQVEGSPGRTELQS